MTYAVSVGPVVAAGVGDDGAAVFLEVKGALSGKPAEFAVAVLTPAVPHVVGALLAWLNAANGMLHESGQAESAPRPLGLHGTQVLVEKVDDKEICLHFLLDEGVVLPLVFPRAAGAQLLQQLFALLSS